jgi:serine/threonine-protein kinase RsbT
VPSPQPEPSDAGIGVPVVISVHAKPDAQQARRIARNFLKATGLRARAQDELVLVVAELAMNLVRHTTDGGTITLQFVAMEEGFAVQIESHDSGPGIDNLESSLRDGTSSIGGLGGGFATVRNLVDDFSISSNPGGTHISVRRWTDRA